jgi:hypothetical protein
MNNAAADSEIYTNGRTYAEHCAWIESMTDDEKEILYCPVGHRATFVMISIIKRWLQLDLEAEYRLKFLEFLDRRSNDFTREAIAQIEPMCDEAHEIYKEAMKLGAKKALDVLGRCEVFSAFIALNPSILTAIKMPRRYHNTRSN